MPKQIGGYIIFGAISLTVAIGRSIAIDGMAIGIPPDFK